MLLFLYLHLKSFSFRFKKLTVNRFTWTETKILPRPAHFPISYMLLKLRFCEPLTRCPRSPLAPGWPGAPGAPCRDIAKIHLTGLTGLSLLNTSSGFWNLERGFKLQHARNFLGCSWIIYYLHGLGTSPQVIYYPWIATLTSST